MEQFASMLTVAVLLTIIYMYMEGRTHEVVFVKSNVNGKEYLVRNLPDKQNAADLLAKLSLKLESFVDHLKKTDNSELFSTYVGTKDQKEKEKEFSDAVNRLVNNFNPDQFSESTPDAKYTSYSVNKGEKIVFCLRSKKNEENLVKENTMMFVALHELGHLMTKSVGHTPEFWDNFKLLLKIAISIGVYKYIDFNSKPEEYCGTEITDTPYKQ
jgi:aromatic ring hydroxylase